MLLFKARFHEAIREGSLTVTYRAWRSARVGVGRQYRTAAGLLEVTGVEEVDREAITEAQARAAAYRTRDELLCDLDGPSTAAIFRVRFRYLGPVEAKPADISPAGLAKLAQRLDAIDARSRQGPWTRQVLKLIAEHPETAAARLARRLGREKLAFKADVRKLKELGLTRSLPVGYELTPAGRALAHRE